MAQFNSLIVTGDSRFLNPINGNARNGVYTVIGTQTAATASWTGNINVDSLYDGLAINYYLPYAGVTSTKVTLTLTLNSGSDTGAIKVFLVSGTQLTTHYGAGRTIIMTYYSAGSISVGGTATTEDMWLCDAYYDTNDVALNRPTYSHPITGGRGIKQYSLYARISAGTYSSFTTGGGVGTKTFDGTYYFDPTKIFYYSGGSNVSAGTALGNNGVTLCCVNVDMQYSFNGVTTSSSTSSLTANSPVYLVLDKSSKNLGCYKLKSPYYTQTPSDTGALYVLLGYMRDSYRMDLWMYNPIFIWNGTYLYNYNEKRFDDIAPITGGSVTKYTSSLTFNILRSNIIKQGAVNFISFAITATGAVAASTKLLKIDTNHTASVSGTQNIVAMASDGKVYPMLLTNESGTTIIQSTSASPLTNGVSYYVNGWYQ